jgi:hypothetical protein
MWTLTLVILVNGGASPARFETREYATRAECSRAARAAERRADTYGYCDLRTKK